MARDQRLSWPDERLVAECLKGNEPAWTALIEKYKNLIYSIPVKLGMHEDASDIFQSVCLDLLSDLPRLRQPRALPKWLMQTCYHKCLQYQRRAGGHAVAAQPEDPEEMPDSNSLLPDDLLCGLEKEQMLRDALSELSPRCERMIRMLFYEAPVRSYDEVAQELGLATGSIGFIRGRCLDKLRKQLEKMGF